MSPNSQSGIELLNKWTYRRPCPLSLNNLLVKMWENGKLRQWYHKTDSFLQLKLFKGLTNSVLLLVRQTEASADGFNFPPSFH